MQVYNPDGYKINTMGVWDTVLHNIDRESQETLPSLRVKDPKILTSKNRKMTRFNSKPMRKSLSKNESDVEYDIKKHR